MTATEGRARSWGDLAAAAVAAALGVVLLVGALQINFAAGYDRIGPRFFPYAVGVGLIALGAALAGRVALTKTQRASPEMAASDDEPINWRPLGLVIVALVSTVLLLDRAGFVIASALQLWLVARAFGSKRTLRDATVAVLLPTIVYYAFSRGLGLSLPGGVLDRIS